MSRDGKFLVGSMSKGNDINMMHAFLWSHEAGVVLLPGPPAIRSSAYAISANGKLILGGYLDMAGHDHIMLWNRNGLFWDLGTLGVSYAEASDISADGSAIAGNYIGSGFHNHQFYLSARTGFRDLGTIGANHGIMVLSDNGQVIFGADHDNFGYDGQLFRWTPSGGLTYLTPSSGPRARVVGVSSSGKLVSGLLNIPQNERTGFYWTEKSGIQLIKGPYISMEYMKISDDGAVITADMFPSGIGIIRQVVGKKMDIVKPADDFYFSVGERGVSSDGAMMSGSFTHGGDSVDFYHWDSCAGSRIVEQVNLKQFEASAFSDDTLTVAGSFNDDAGNAHLFIWDLHKRIKTCHAS